MAEKGGTREQKEKKRNYKYEELVFLSVSLIVIILILIDISVNSYSRNSYIPIILIIITFFSLLIMSVLDFFNKRKENKLLYLICFIAMGVSILFWIILFIFMKPN